MNTHAKDLPSEASPPKKATSVEKFLGKELASKGWLATPKSLIRNWRFLKGIDRTDVLLLQILMDYRTSQGGYKAASVKAISAQLDMGERAVRERIRKLKAGGFIIQSDDPGKKRTYDVKPLFEKLLEAQKRFEKSRGE